MIELNNIDVSFNEKKLFDSLNLNINDGEFVVLVGDNGAGKSTLLNLIAGNVRPDSGQILFDGTDVTKLSTDRRAKYIGRVFQDPKVGTCADMTILENISLYLNKGHNFDLRRGLTHQREFFKEFELDLDERLHTSVSTLNGGQRQVLSLIMATFCQPPILLLDEHTAALDPATSNLVMKQTAKLVAKFPKMITIMVTHNMKMALDYGDRLLFFKNGKIRIDAGQKNKSEITLQDLASMYE